MVGEGAGVVGFAFFRGQIGLALAGVGHEEGEARIVFDGLAADPRLGGGSAPSVVDQADRHIENVVQIAAVNVADGAEVFDVGGIGDLPLALEIGLQILRADLRDGNNAKMRTTGAGAFEVAGVGLPDGPLHVGLAGAHPDLTDEDVFDFTASRAGNDGEGLRGFVGGLSGEFDGPAPVGAGSGGIGLTGERDGDGGAGGIPTPDRVGQLLLQDHVIAKDGGELEFGPGEREERECECNGDERARYFHREFWGHECIKSMGADRAWIGYLRVDLRQAIFLPRVLPFFSPRSPSV